MIELSPLVGKSEVQGLRLGSVVRRSQKVTEFGVLILLRHTLLRGLDLLRDKSLESRQLHIEPVSLIDEFEDLFVLNSLEFLKLSTSIYMLRKQFLIVSL